MNRVRRHVTLAAVATALAVTWWAAKAAPILPQQIQLTDEMRTTAGIDRVRIHVAEIPALLRDLGVDRDDIRRTFREQLVEADIQVDDDPQLPRLGLLVLRGVDPDMPDALALTVVIAVHQKVMVERLNQRTTAATMSFSKASLATRQGAEDKLKVEIRVMVNQLVKIIRMASKDSSAS